jgi:hypothetical protein
MQAQQQPPVQGSQPKIIKVAQPVFDNPSEFSYEGSPIKVKEDDVLFEKFDKDFQNLQELEKTHGNLVGIVERLKQTTGQFRDTKRQDTHSGFGAEKTGAFKTAINPHDTFKSRQAEGANVAKVAPAMVIGETHRGNLGLDGTLTQSNLVNEKQMARNKAGYVSQAEVKKTLGVQNKYQQAVNPIHKNGPQKSHGATPQRIESGYSQISTAQKNVSKVSSQKFETIPGKTAKNYSKGTVQLKTNFNPRDLLCDD